MAHKKGVGSTDNGRDSISKRLGVKLFGGELATAGNILVRQRGTRYHPGENVYMGRDFTLHAKVDGTVTFRRKRNNRLYVNIVPSNEIVEKIAKIVPKAKAKAAPKAKPAPAKKVAAPVQEAPAPVQEKAAPMAAPAPAAKKKSEKIALPSGKKIIQDDLKMVEGIGPKIEGLLHAAGIMTWKNLAEAPEADVQKILDDAGPRYRMHQPKTWASQAEIAHKGDWARLEKYQDWLIGGRAPEGETFEG